MCTSICFLSVLFVFLMPGGGPYQRSLLLRAGYAGLVFSLGRFSSFFYDVISGGASDCRCCFIRCAEIHGVQRFGSACF